MKLIIIKTDSVELSSVCQLNGRIAVAILSHELWLSASIYHAPIIM